MIDLGIVYIASYALRSLLPEVTGTGAYVTIWILSFTVTALQLIFKLVDTKYDMLIALLFPLFKLIPFFIAMRDSFSSGYEYKQHIINDRETSQGKLVAYYRLYDTFVGVRKSIFAHYTITIILSVFIAILVQRPHWMLSYTLMLILHTFTLVIFSLQLYPSRWMTEECHKVDTERYLADIGRMRLQEGRNEVLLPPQ